MAEASLSSTTERDSLTCQVCLELFRSPRSLPCSHTFCTECVEYMIKTTASDGKFSITCPTCMITTELTTGHMESLKVNIYVECLVEALKTKHSTVDNCAMCQVMREVNKRAYCKCLDCDDFLCEPCAYSHVLNQNTMNHNVITLDDMASIVYEHKTRTSREVICSAHQGQIVQFLCITCDLPVCRHCFTQNHVGHHVKNAEMAVDILNTQIDSLIKQVNEKCAECQSRDAENAIGLTKVCKEEEVAVNTIYDLLAELMNRITTEGEEAIDMVTRSFSVAKKELTERGEIEARKLRIIKETKRICDGVMGNGNAVEILSLTSFLKEQLQTLESSSVSEKYEITNPFTIRKSDSVNKNKLNLFYIDKNDTGSFDDIDEALIVWPRDGKPTVGGKKKHQTQGCSGVESASNKTPDRRVFSDGTQENIHGLGNLTTKRNENQPSDVAGMTDHVARNEETVMIPGLKRVVVELILIILLSIAYYMFLPSYE